VTNIQGGSLAETFAPAMSEMISRPIGSLIGSVKEQLARVVENFVPGHSDSTLAGNDDKGSVTPVEGNASGFSNVNTLPVGKDQTPAIGMLQEDEKTALVQNDTASLLEDNHSTVLSSQVDGVIESVQNAAAPLPAETDYSLALSNPVQGEVSMSGSGFEREVSAMNADQSATGVVAEQQGKSKNTLFRYSLVGLLLAGLAVVFFVVVLPKTNKRREQ